MSLGEEIEKLRRDIEANRKEFDAKSQLCESELMAGRTGLDAFQAAEALLREMKSLSTALKEKIDAALKGLGG